MKNFPLILSTVAVILAAVALINSYKTQVQSVNTESVAAALKESPKMIVEAMDIYQKQQQEEALAEREKALETVNNADGLPFVGPEDASVTVVEFFDFSCGYCKRLAPSIEKLIADNADVKFVFKPVSFVAPISRPLAQAAIAAHKQGKYVEFYKAVFEHEGRVTEADIDTIAQSLNMNVDQFKKDMNSAETKQTLGNVLELMQKLQIGGVPTLFVNKKSVQSISADEIQEVINSSK
ncbi:MAG: DsbA family protein [Alphaproteobacteria bacterium]|nr:DsbA family protein [Alphaproteobacteria bacterium]